MAFDPQLQKDLNDMLSRLGKMFPELKKTQREDMKEAAKILSSAISARTPVGEKAHKRYPKRGKGKKAAKGAGRVVAEYRPGNLRRSIQVLTFRRSPAAFVGPKLGGRRADGYYAHMVERGTVSQPPQYFVRAGISAAGNTALRFAAELTRRRIESFKRQNGFL